VVALLQLLLANFTQGSLPSFRDLEEDSDEPEQMEQMIIDSAREKEILGKAITGILLLMLKWFRASRLSQDNFLTLDVLKFEYLSQLLYDSNYHILCARLLGMDTPVLAIAHSNEIPALGYLGSSLP